MKFVKWLVVVALILAVEYTSHQPSSKSISLANLKPVEILWTNVDNAATGFVCNASFAQLPVDVYLTPISTNPVNFTSTVPRVLIDTLRPEN